MKKVIMLALAIVMIGLTNCTNVPPGSVGIIVHNLGENKGVDNVSATTGFTWYNPISTSIFKYPTNMQTAKWTKDPNEGKPINEEITFTNKDNMAISVDVSVSYSLIYEKVPYFYVKFRNDDIEQFTHGFLRNVTRDAFNETGGSYDIDHIMGDNTKFIQEVTAKVQKKMDEIGVKVEQLGIIGAPRPPESVVTAINSKLQATQIAIQKENEVRQSIAQANKDIAEAKGDSASKVIRAAGDAKANQLRQASLTENIIRSQMLDKWDGKLPTYGTVPTIFKDVK